MDPVTRAELTRLAREIAAIINSAKSREDAQVGSDCSLPTFRDVGVGSKFHPMRQDTQKRLINLVGMNAGVPEEQAEFLRNIGLENTILSGEVLDLDPDSAEGFCKALIVVQYINPNTKKIKTVRAWVNIEELQQAKGDDCGMLPLPKPSKEFPVGSSLRIRI